MMKFSFSSFPLLLSALYSSHSFAEVATHVDVAPLLNSLASCYDSYHGSAAELLSNEALCLVGEMSPHFNLNQQIQYLMPIKKAAGRLKATSYARGDYSFILRTRLISLRSALRRARSFAEENMEIEAVFDLMVDFIAIEERLTAEME